MSFSGKCLAFLARSCRVACGVRYLTLPVSRCSTRKYVPCLYVYNKIDAISIEGTLSPRKYHSLRA
jgi:translation elongation factor EF-G